MTQPRTRQRPTNRAPRHTLPPRDANGCRCQTTPEQPWPTTHAHHLGEATYRITRRHQAQCGLPAEPIDPTTWRTR